MASIDRYNQRLVAHSLIEVIASTLIILVAFLMFSMFLGKVTQSRHIVPETQAVLQINQLRESECGLDTSRIQRLFPGIRCQITVSQLGIGSYVHLQYRTPENYRTIFELYLSSLCPDTNYSSLFDFE